MIKDYDLGIVLRAKLNQNCSKILNICTKSAPATAISFCIYKDFYSTAFSLKRKKTTTNKSINK